ncbi:DUF721 domain-containing protein [Thermosipho atlanticus]|uniref:DUF721 domain-containing protein n=1 Tax=Thermosipho atlanticus DSM 15807 TaxID=1123380 RepID=A0A1M5T5I2_9BACT|nr:DUF721 domain-containing protein [Thermosipho atlanticus]SHH45984.1 Protein of unknown function [Thermosipho atlanticus DSM 15807]
MKKLGEVFKEVAIKNKLFRKLYVNTISKEEFSNMIGKPFNEYCEVTNFLNGTLFIECDDNIYVTELNFFKEKIREELNKKIGFKAINKVVIKHRR